MHANSPSSRDAEAGGLQIVDQPIIYSHTVFFISFQKQDFFLNI